MTIDEDSMTIVELGHAAIEATDPKDRSTAVTKLVYRADVAEAYLRMSFEAIERALTAMTSEQDDGNSTALRILCAEMLRQRKANQ